MKAGGRVILHIDLDAFFATAETVANPSLRGRSVVVGGHPGGSAAVACASYEARARGIRSGMSVAEAAEIAPDAVFLPCSPRLYFDLSGRFLRILLMRSPLVEAASIDEAYLDAAGLAGTLEAGEILARSIQEEIEERTGLTGSVGIGPNKRIAKAASSERKPRGRTVLDVDSYRARFSGRPVEALEGVGRGSVDHLAAAGIRTVGDLAVAAPHFLHRILGTRGISLGEAARGEDPSPVVPVGKGRDPRTLGHQFTFRRGEGTREAVHRVILSLSEAVAWDLRDERWIAEGIQLKIGSREGLKERRCRLPNGKAAPRTIVRLVQEMFRGIHADGEVRVIGVSAIGLRRGDPERGAGEASMGDLFHSDRENRFDAVSDSLRSLFGRHVLRRASLLREPGRGEP